jgi:hypothetical protein
MAHFAKVENDIVTQVLVVSNDDAPTEIDGKTFLALLGLEGEWVQTSYNNNPNSRRISSQICKHWRHLEWHSFHRTATVSIVDS